jgi:hypothetical protein
MLRLIIVSGGLALGVGCSVVGCGGAGANGDLGSGTDTGKRDTEFKHEPCDLTSSDAETMTADATGRPVIITVRKGGRPGCRAVDFNRDGTIDVFVYYDEQGRDRRREYGFDRPDRPNEIDYFQDGQLIRKERETNNDGKIDTWDYYEGGRLAREERDTSGDGLVHEWWTFPAPGSSSCPFVVTDVDGSGKPKPETRMDMCPGQEPSGSTAAGRPDAGAADAASGGAVSDAGAALAVPTEGSSP